MPAGASRPSFAAERQATDTNLFEAVVNRLLSRAPGRAAHHHRLLEHRHARPHGAGAQGPRPDQSAHGGKLARRRNHQSPPPRRWWCWRSKAGFETKDLLVLSEQDILGERILRPQRKKKASDALTEAASLAAGDLVVHVDHGIGRFLGLKVIEAGGAPHECVEIEYAGDTKLYLPVENIELLSRYGSDDADTSLDKLGGVAWQAKKGKLKKRIREMAEQLIKIAAQRAC